MTRLRAEVTRNATAHPGQGWFTRSQKIALIVTAAAYVAAAVAVYAFIDEQVLATVLKLPATLVAALLALSLVNYGVRAWRWVLLSEHLGLRVPLGRNVLYYLAGYAFTSTPGKAGEAVRLWFLKVAHGVGYARSLPLMLADRVIDMWAVVILCAVSVAGFAAFAMQWLAVAAVVIVALSVVIIFPRSMQPLIGYMARLAPKRRRLLVKLRRVLHAMADLASWRSYGVTLPPTVIGWVAECGALYLLLQGLGADVSLANAVFVFAFSVIVGALSMLPGGLGSTEATIIILLKTLGVDLDVALAATAIIRCTTFWFAVALGMLLMPAAIGAARPAQVAATPRHPGVM